MQEPESPNPYGVTQSEPYAATVVGPRKFPTVLRVYAIIALVLGILGLLTALSTIGMNAAGVSSTMNGQSGLGEDFQESMDAMANKYRLANTLLGVVQLVCCAALVAGAVLTLKSHPKAWRVFLLACMALIIFEIGRAIPITLSLIDSFKIMQSFQGELIAPPPGGQPMPQHVVNTVVFVGIIVGTIIAVFWLLVKLVFYTLAARYVSRPETKAFLAGNVPA